MQEMFSPLDSNKKPKWSTPESELPSTASASIGDVLTLDSDKEPVWSAPVSGLIPQFIAYLDSNSSTSKFNFKNLDGTDATVGDMLSHADSSGYVIIWVVFKSTVYSGYLVTLKVEESDDTQATVSYPLILDYGNFSSEHTLIVISEGSGIALKTAKNISLGRNTFTLTATT